MKYEAEQDGVEVIENGLGRCHYLIPCEICSRKIRRYQYSRKRTYICDYCKGVIKKKGKANIPISETKFDRRFNVAIENVKKSVKDFRQYERAIEIAKTRIYNYGSIPEAMAAIELLKNKIRIIPQQKIGKYKVDFVLPDLKVVLEIDGELYHSNTEKEAERDFAIYLALGFEWKIIHYPSSYVLKDITKLTQYVFKSKEI